MDTPKKKAEHADPTKTKTNTPSPTTRQNPSGSSSTAKSTSKTVRSTKDNKDSSQRKKDDANYRTRAAAATPPPPATSNESGGSTPTPSSMTANTSNNTNSNSNSINNTNSSSTNAGAVQPATPVFGMMNPEEGSPSIGRLVIDENGNVLASVTGSPLACGASSSNVIDEECACRDEMIDEEDIDQKMDEELVSIAQPLTNHGSVSLDKFRAQREQMLEASGKAAQETQGSGVTSSSNLTSPVTCTSPVTVTSPAPGNLVGAARTHPRRHGRNSTDDTMSSLQAYLFLVPHLTTLPMDEIAKLHVMVREFQALDLVVDVDMPLQHVYVLANGSVEVFNQRHGTESKVGHKRVASIAAPNIFGVDSVVFDRPTEFVMRCGSEKATILLIPKAEFLALFQRNRTFARSVGHKLIDHIPIFNVFQEFCRSIFAMSSAVDKQNMYSDGYTLSMPDILESYMKLDSVIHPKRKSTELDYNAWKYALRRLPQNITETFVLNLARSLPPFLAKEIRADLDEACRRRRSSSLSRSSSFCADLCQRQSVTFIETRDRRRCAWKVGDRGNTLVLVREGFTDVIDLVTCFCIHLIEARKLRMRLQGMIHPSALTIINQAFDKVQDENDLEQIAAAEAWCLSQLPLSPAEQKGLLNMWPHSCLTRMFSILTHREEVVVKIDTSLSKRFDLDPYLQWALTIRRHVEQSLRRSEYDELPDNVVIDILSSNTHTTKNLLCSFAPKRKQIIMDWAKKNCPEIVRENWTNDEDKLYYLFGAMTSTDEGRKLREEFKATLRSCGFIVVEETSMTGLQVDIVDVSKLKQEYIDSELQTVFSTRSRSASSYADNNSTDAFNHTQPQEAATSQQEQTTTTTTTTTNSPSPQKHHVRSDSPPDSGLAPHFIINMDFAFGAQADGITRALILTFGHNIRSINVVGKSAGLLGRRGDVQIPDALLFSKAALGEDSTDETRNVNCNHDTIVTRLHELLPDRNIHVGTVVTSPGTVLQNPTLMRYYKTVYNAVGQEMEGSYFARQVEESVNLNMVRSDIKTRYAYYTHDVPNGPMHIYQPLEPIEGVPPLYAIIRSMLEQLLLPEGK